MRTINLTRGYSAIVDDDDYARLAQHKWQANVCKNAVYAMRREGGGVRRCHYMHREVMGNPPALMIDHIDSNGLNNSKSNLRIATRSQNFCNRRSLSGSVSKFLGVGLNGGKWTAHIRVGGKQVSLGRFTEEEAAARAYDTAARHHHGEFARPNFKVKNG